MLEITMQALQADRDSGPSARNSEQERPRWSARLRTVIDLDAPARPVSDAATQVALISIAAALYFGVRDLTKDQAALAFANARALVRLEASLGMNVEAAAQAVIIDHDHVITFFNWIYIYGHWPVIAGALVYTLMRARPQYLLFRDSLIISGAIGLVFFALYPVAPPRLADPTSFFDSLELSQAYRVLQPQGIVNRYAALPSFHVGWNLLAALALWHAPALRRMRPLTVAMPLLMMAAVVLTANHWLIDVFAGAAIALAGHLGARRVHRGRVRRMRQLRFDDRSRSAATSAVS